MEKKQLLTAASAKLAEAVILLLRAGEERLAADARELTEWVVIRATSNSTKAPTPAEPVPATR